MSGQIGLVLSRAGAALFEAVKQRPEIAALIWPTAAMLSVMGPDIDGYVPHRLEQAERIKAILTRARVIVPPATAAHIDAAIGVRLSAPADFMLQTVDAHVATLKRALMQVHIWLERDDAAAHGEVLDEVWAFLQADADHEGRLVPDLW